MDGVEQSKMEQGIRRTWTNKYVSIAMVMSILIQGFHGKDAKVREAGGRRRDYADSKFPSFLTKF
jgi:hypothetical protein